MRKVVIGAVTIALTAGACSQKAIEPFRDAPTTGHDRTPAQVIEMPDGFNNLATKCVDGIRYTVTYHHDSPYGSVAVTGGDNGCGK